jgi:hypothetical protein
MGFEAGQIVGSSVSDLAQALRPRPPGVGRSQVDTWKPPAGLDAKMAAAFQSAMDVLERAQGKVGQLRNRLSSIGASLNNLASHPIVREAQERASAALSALRRSEQGLAAAAAARSAIDALDDNITKVSAAAAANFQPVEFLENNIARTRAAVAAAQDEIISLTQTVDGADPLSLPPPSKLLTAKQESLASLQRQLNRDLADLVPLKANHQDTLKNLDALMARRDAAMRELAGHGDVQPRDVERLRAEHQKLMADFAATQSRVMGEIGNQYEAARALLIAAETEESLAAAYLRGLRAQLERAGAAAQPSIGRRTLEGTTMVLTLPLVPLMWLWEKGFGTVQSTPEAFEILIRGERRITEMTRNVTKVERAVEKMRKDTEHLRGVLQTCMDDAKPREAARAEAAAAARAAAAAPPSESAA